MPTGVYKRTKWHKMRQRQGMLGHKVSDSARKKISEAQKGEKHWNWKGDGVSYRTLHNWVVNNWGKADKCEKCGTLEGKIYDWANISKKYKRERNDWKQLCRKCHMEEDGVIEAGKKTRFRKGESRDDFLRRVCK